MKKERPAPYVGLDCNTKEQVEYFRKVWERHSKKDSPRRFHAGVFTSRKILDNFPSKWAEVYPKPEALATIFNSSPYTMNSLHYVDYNYSASAGDFWKSLAKALAYCAHGANAVQLDMLWPPAAEILNGIHTARVTEPEVILQIGTPAFKSIDWNPQKLIDKLGEYEGVIHHVLLDESMGTGKPLNADVLAPFIEKLAKRFPMLGIGVAGGLGPETMYLIEPLVKAFPFLSTDAASKLRLSGDAKAPIHVVSAEEYLIRTLEMFP